MREKEDQAFAEICALEIRRWRGIGHGGRCHFENTMIRWHINATTLFLFVRVSTIHGPRPQFPNDAYRYSYHGDVVRRKKSLQEADSLSGDWTVSVGSSLFAKTVKKKSLHRKPLALSAIVFFPSGISKLHIWAFGLLMHAHVVNVFAKTSRYY